MKHIKVVLLFLYTLYSIIHAYDNQPKAKVQLRMDSFHSTEEEHAQITMCFDHEEGNDDITECQHIGFKATYDEYRLRSLRKMTTPEERLYNPLAFDVGRLQDRFKLKVYLVVAQHFYGLRYSSSTYHSTAEIDSVPFPSYNNATYHNKTLELDGNRSLSFSFMVYCKRNYYGNDCGRYCREDKYGRVPYSCDPQTGAKISPSGWEPGKRKCSRCKTDIVCISLGTMALVFIIGNLVFVILKYHRGSAATKNRAREPAENSHCFFQPIYMGDLTGFLRPTDTDCNTTAKPKRASCKLPPSFDRHAGLYSEMERNPYDDRLHLVDAEADDIWPMHEDWLSTFAPSAQGANPVD